MVLMLLAALAATAHAGEKKAVNLGLVPSAQKAATVQVSNPPQGDPSRSQGDPSRSQGDPNVRLYPAGGAEDLLKVTKPFDDSADDAIREGDQRQSVESQRLQNQLPSGLSNQGSRVSTPLNAQGR